MEAEVLHQPRVAFDAARILIDLSGADDQALYEWYGDQLAVVLGRSIQAELLTTRHELKRSLRANGRSIEAGKWRVRLEDVLRTRAGVAEGLHDLTASARARLASVN